MIRIDLRANLGPLHRAIIDLGARQVPFAMSLALNELAKGVAADERRLIDETFETPTPFTENAYRIQVATKTRQIAVVSAKDIQAQYLEPYVTGGPRFLGTKRAMLAPRGVGLNRYGNLTKGKLATLKGKPGVFIGPVTTKSGRTINGVWQRAAGAKTGRGQRGQARPAGHLKLLIQFEDTSEAPKHLPFEQRARAYIDRNARAAFGRAMQRATATARR